MLPPQTFAAPPPRCCSPASPTLSPAAAASPHIFCLVKHNQWPRPTNPNTCHPTPKALPKAARRRTGVAATDCPLGQRPVAGGAAASGEATYGEKTARGGGGTSGAKRAQGRGARKGAGAAPVEGWLRAAGEAAGGEVSRVGKLASGKGSLRGGAHPASNCGAAEHAGARCHTLSYDVHIHRRAIVSSRPGLSRFVTGALLVRVPHDFPTSGAPGARDG